MRAKVSAARKTSKQSKRTHTHTHTHTAGLLLIQTQLATVYLCVHDGETTSRQKCIIQVEQFVCVSECESYFFFSFFHTELAAIGAPSRPNSLGPARLRF